MSARPSFSDLRSERAVLGALLHSPRSLADIDSIIRAEHFTDPQNAVLYIAIVDMLADGIDPDEVSLIRWLGDHGLLASAGGAGYVSQLRDDLPDTGNIAHYAKLVAATAERKALHRFGQTVQALAASSATSTEAIELAEREFLRLRSNGQDDRGEVTIGEAAQTELGRLRAENSGSAVNWPRLGFEPLDDLLGGLRPGQLVVIGARTSVGKTAMGLQVALHTALVQSKRVLFVSLEMSREQLARRAMAMTARVSLGRLTHANLDDYRWQETGGYWPAVERSVLDLQQAGITIVDLGHATPGALRARCKAAQFRGPLDLVVVDYLQLMRSGEKHSGRVEEVGAISRSLKLAARELGVPILALCQLNRDAAKRDDGKAAYEAKTISEPRLSDLRESGSIENDADAVILLHRQIEGEHIRITSALAILAKNRTGPTGRVTMAYDLTTCRFEGAKRVQPQQ